MSTAYSASSVIIPAQGGGGKAGTLYGWRPDVNQLQDIDVVRNTTASRVNEAGLIEFVGVNVPRFDWGEGGSCPSLLVEPERTNLLLRSEEFDNAVWQLSSAASVSGNTTTAPDGNLTGDNLSFAPLSFSRIRQDISLTANTYTFSVYAKSATGKKFRLRIDGTFGDTSPDITTTTEWTRYTYTLTTDITSIAISNEENGGVGEIQIWGAQLEAGSYPTSYIKTEASQETRNADVISKTGISSLINSSEGTLYAKIAFKTKTATALISINDGTTDNSIYLGYSSASNVIRSVISSGGVASANLLGVSDIEAGEFYKIAVKYKLNDFALYINGVEVATDLSGITPVGLNTIEFSFTSILPFIGDCQELIVYPTALTSAEAIALTTP